MKNKLKKEQLQALKSAVKKRDKDFKDKKTVKK